MGSEGHRLPKRMTDSSHGCELTTLEEMRTSGTPLQACEHSNKTDRRDFVPHFGNAIHVYRPNFWDLVVMGGSYQLPARKWGGGNKSQSFQVSQKSWRNTTQKELEKNSKEKSEDYFFFLPLNSAIFNTSLLIDWSFQGLGLKELPESEYFQPHWRDGQDTRRRRESFQASFTFIMGLSGLQRSLYFHEYPKGTDKLKDRAGESCATYEMSQKRRT